MRLKPKSAFRIQNSEAHHNRAFTMIELLIVVSVIAILAAITVPNFLEAQVRSKVARTKSDMAAISAALKSYYADYNRYPPNNESLRDFLKGADKLMWIGEKNLPTPTTAPLAWSIDNKSRPQVPRELVGQGSGRGNFTWPILIFSGGDLSVLTTPTPYLIGSLPVDPFADIRQSLFVYANLEDLESTAALKSVSGPSRRYLLMSYGPSTSQSTFGYNHPTRGPFIQYDPTNGTVSSGVIAEFGNGVSEVPPDLVQPKAGQPNSWGFNPYGPQDRGPDSSAPPGSLPPI
ncbi:MAG: type II secretion system GspH family protein [Candidatus Sumerlaeaceae bacterium]|nr:type II secretion system GspH family protein [Candidatus Sumerlaeaceae bacterium]